MHDRSSRRRAAPRNGGSGGSLSFVFCGGGGQPGAPLSPWVDIARALGDTQRPEDPAGQLGEQMWGRPCRAYLQGRGLR